MTELVSRAVGTPQIVACSARIPEPDRARFLELMADAAVLASWAAKMRREAWALYRRATGSST
jgi:hypothetical protein